jgi:hypothetical protein
MRKCQNLCFSMLLVCAFVGSAAAQGQVEPADQTQPQTGTTAAAPVTTVNQAIDRIIAREHDEVATIRHYDPLIETYVQEMRPDSDMGVVPVRDHYFLGEADLARGVVDNSMLSRTSKNRLDQINPVSHLSDLFKSEFVPAGFLQMIYIDTNDFNRQHYKFDYVRTEFLGDVKCYVFDVTPLPKSGRGRFKGRIWAENQGFTIVRFNGVYTPVSGINGYNLHFDSWRLNLQPGLWLPAYIYSQESDLKDLLGGHVHFRAQTRLWGYDLKNVSHETEFSELTIESPTAIQDQAAAEQQDTGPVSAERAWQHEAELNVLDRLQRVGLLAPAGDIDKLLETVENNLEVANNLDIEPQVHCRVLLTGTLESFTIGHTIVLSRGLIDVLPDEASLATVLAQELADLMVIKPSDDQYGFNDTTQISTLEVMSRFSFRDNPDQVQRASDKAVQLLKNSIYKDKLGSAGLFLKQLEVDSKSLTALINPHLGNSVYLAQQLIASSPQLQPNKIDQIAALPIGARLKLDPWTDRVELLKAKPVPLYSAREKMPFEVTPFMPYLTRYEKPRTGVSAASTQPDVAKQQQSQPRQSQPQP